MLWQSERPSILLGNVCKGQGQSKQLDVHEPGDKDEMLQ